MRNIGRCISKNTGHMVRWEKAAKAEEPIAAFPDGASTLSCRLQVFECPLADNLTVFA